MAGADWRSVIGDQVAVNAANTRKHHAAASNMQNISRVGFGVGAHPFVVRAARERNISIAGYIRRATLGFVAMDLGLDLRMLLEVDVTPSRYGNGGPGRGIGPGKDLDGELYGSWAVRPDDD